MTILMLLERIFPSDIRVEKESRALIKAGHEVIILCPRAENQQDKDSYNGIKIFRFNAKYTQKFFNGKLLLGYQALTFRNALWYKKIMEMVRANRIDVLHVHDLPLSSTAVAVRKKTGIPVIADLHENYPELLRIRFGGSDLSWKDRLLVGTDRWANHERKILQEVDHIIVVVEEAKERLMSIGLPAAKISIVSNTESEEFWESHELDKALVKQYEDSFIASYIGGFGEHRGIDTAIKAIELISRKTHGIRLLLVGSGGWYSDTLERMTLESRVSDLVKFIPWVPMKKVPSYLELSDVGLVPHSSNPHTESTVPHKLFQYMLFGKPVIVSDCRPLKRIVEEAGAGLVFKAGNPEDLAEKILTLYDSPEACKNYGENGKNAATIGKYSWNNEKRRLMQIYNGLQ